jgi:hypothetical protein
MIGIVVIVLVISFYFAILIAINVRRRRQKDASAIVLKKGTINEFLFWLLAGCLALIVWSMIRLSVI